MPNLILLATTVHGRVLVEAAREGRGTGGAGLLVGFHGYGENAERHLAELAAIPGCESWVLAAVQGLHPFYNSKTGEVVASWMTKQDREAAIADNVAYVRAVVERVRAETGAAGPLVYLGFSQGVAMAYRAAALAGHPAAAVIAIGGDLPPELAEAGFGTIAAGTQVRALVARGADDAWYTTEKLAADLDALTRHGLAVESAVYAGGHEWTAEVRSLAGRVLREIDGAGSTAAPETLLS